MAFCPRHSGRRADKVGAAFIATALTSLVILQGCSTGGPLPGLYVASIDGGAPGWIAESTAAPVWSPSGDTIAWGDEDGLRVQNVGDDASHVLGVEPVSGRPAWSPDGAALAYISQETQELVVVDAIEGKDRLRANISNYSARTPPQSLLDLGGPSWNRDGSRLVFTCWDGAGDEVCLIDTDGGNRVQVTSLEPFESAQAGANGQSPPAASNVGPAVWSPDGSKIAVAAYAERSGGASGVFLIDLQSDSGKRIATMQPNSEIVWSPDGGSVYFSATQKGRSDVVQVYADGREPIVLSGDLPDGAWSPVPSPDNDAIAVASGEMIVILENGEQSVLYKNDGQRPTNPAWNASGDRIAFIASTNPIQGYN